jgi:protein TonB
MSYVDQGMSRSRVYAIIAVAILHALLAYAFVTGLAYKFVKNVSEDLKTFDVTEEPPPPPDEPPPEQPQVQTPPIVAPPPMIRINTPAPMIQTVINAPPPIITPTAPPAPPPPPPPRIVQPVRARANLTSYFSDDDYPPSALRAEEQGTTGFRLTIGPDGRVANCEVTSSSGSNALDQATCRILRSRARYTPARDQSGNPTSGTDQARVQWRLPPE